MALAEFVAESIQLVQLDLRANSIKTAGLMALSHSLKVNRTVTRVDLDREPKKENVGLAILWDLIFPNYTNRTVLKCKKFTELSN